MAIQNKFHITIDGYGFMLARQIRTERHIYGREEIPHFVNKFSSGDPNYRDSTFFPHFVQNNWLNGFDQEKFNDGGKFYRSSQVDPTIQEKLTLQKAIASTGTIGAGAKCFGVRSSSASLWWNTDYDYRQQLTITAPSGQGLPVGLPVETTIDTAALETATKLLANRNDWRIVYYNGSTFTDLTRDYITTTRTFFALQAAIAAGQSDSNYYVYYGHSGAADNKQPTDEAGWNAVYGMFGTTPDANYMAIWHFKEGTGTSVDDDTSQEHTLTLNGSVSWGTDGILGRRLTFTSGGYGETPDASDLDLGTMTFEALVYRPAGQEMYILSHGKDALDKNYHWQVNGSGKLNLKIAQSAGSEFEFTDTGSGIVPANTPTWVSTTYDAAGTIKHYYNGVLSSTGSIGMSTPTGSSRSIYMNGYKNGSDSLVVNGANSIQHVAISNIVRTSFPAHISSTNQPTAVTGGEIVQASIPSTGTFEIYAADIEGKVYLWDGTSVWTEVFDTRRIKWFDTVSSGDTDYYVGDNGGTERAQAQSFQLDTAQKVKSVQVYIKKATGTPGDITVRIETDSTGPSGSLVDSNLATTIPAFTTGTYGWVTVEFPAAFTLSASTTYWVVLKTAAAANDNNYQWLADASSPSFSGGSRAYSGDGGSTWTVDTAADFMIRIRGEATQVNQIAQATFSSTTKLYFAVGDPENNNQANARVFTYDGTVWVLNKIFTGVGSGCALCLQVYNSKLYVGLGPTALVYVTSDGSTWTVAKDIDQPDNPGYIYDMEVYNQRLYACGGNPEYVSDNNSQGFLFSFDEFQWNFVYDFSFTVLKSLKVFDNLLFLGTTSKKLYVYNTASMDKLLDFPWDVSINWMEVFDDKLAIGLGYINSLTGEEAVYLFDRNGFHKAFVPPSVGVNCIISTRNQLLIGTTGTTIYRVNPLVYASSGSVQLSYFEASLPSIDKKWQSVILHTESLPTGTSILLQYKTDESDSSWTTIGTYQTTGATIEEFEFNSTFYSKKISILATLATSNTAVTPTLKIIDLKYVLMPDFKYLWKLSVVCADNMIWLDGTEPLSLTSAAIVAGATSISVDDASGFPTKGRGVIVDSGVEDEFTWTGKTATTLTGIPSSGSLSLSTHTSTDLTVKITGGSMHRLLRSLKQGKQLYDFIDFDGTEYDVLFHGYQEDNFVINTDGQENNVPITLLEV